MSRRPNTLDQDLDIAGSLTKVQNATLADESSSLGTPVVGQSGASASIVESGGTVTVSGLTGMTVQSVGRYLQVLNGDHPGVYLILTYVSATSVTIQSSVHSGADSGNPTIQWVERNPYSLEDDLNFVRTDRVAIKGTTNYYDAIPTYERPSAVGTSVPANLSNLSGKSLDAKALVVNRKYAGQAVSSGTTYLTVTDTGNLQHATTTDRTGVPVFDGADAGNHDATYVEIIDPTTEAALEVLAGPDVGKRIYGRTRVGASTSPNSVEVEFRAVAKGAALSTSVSYTWEAAQPTSVDLFYGYRSRMDQMSENVLRTVLTSGISSDADLAQDVKDIRETIDPNFADDAKSLSGLLTNLTDYFVFSDLPDATPSIVEALNTLNTQIGNRTYTGVLVTSGETVTQSIQSLATAIADSSIVRTIERVTVDIEAGVSHTLPGGISYTVDGTNNGQNMFVFWRGLLRDPGPIADGNDYLETSPTSITPHTKIKAGDHINYLILK